MRRKAIAHFRAILVDSKHFGQWNIVFEAKTRLPCFTWSSMDGQIYDGLDEQLVAVASVDDDKGKKPAAKSEKPAYEGLDQLYQL